VAHAGEAILCDESDRQVLHPRMRAVENLLDGAHAIRALISRDVKHAIGSIYQPYLSRKQERRPGDAVHQ